MTKRIGVVGVFAFVACAFAETLANDWENLKVNILKEMAKRDIPANRIVFTPMLPHPAHMARYRVADLFLDTEICGGHTTAMEASPRGLEK